MLEFLSKEYYGNTIESWLFACFLLLTLVILRKIFLFICNKFILKKLKYIVEKQNIKDVDEDKEEKTFSEITCIGLKHLLKGSEDKKEDDNSSPIYVIINNIISLGSIILSVIMVRYIFSLLYLPIPISEFINTICTIVAVLITAWLLQKIYSELHAHVFTPIANATKNELDDQLLSPIKHCVIFLIWAFAITIGLENAGYHIGAILTGLGIGGLAVAMAAKDTIANILGGFTVLADNPFSINDYIKIESYQGYVQKLGIRSTHLATYGGSVISIPNAKFTDGVVENFSRVKTKKVMIDLHLDYDNNEKQIEKAKQILTDIGKNHNDTTNGEPIVSFHNFGKSALNFKFTYHVNLVEIISKKGNKEDEVFLNSQIVDIKKEINKVRTDINMQIFKKFKEANIKFQEALEISE